MIANLTALLLSTMLALYPGPQSRCIEDRREQIVTMAAASSETYQVPPAILLATAFLETHLGCDNGEGNGWGAPQSRNNRHTAGRSDQAASALALGFERCGTWPGAIAHFRCGRCSCPRLVGYSPRYALRLARRIHRRAGLPPMARPQRHHRAVWRPATAASRPVESAVNSTISSR